MPFAFEKRIVYHKAVTVAAGSFPTDVIVILPPTNVPAASTWCLVILALVLSVVGGVFIRGTHRASHVGRIAS